MWSTIREEYTRLASLGRLDTLDNYLSGIMKYRTKRGDYKYLLMWDDNIVVGKLYWLIRDEQFAISMAGIHTVSF